MDHKRALLLIVLFSSFMTLIIMISAKDMLAELKALLNSDYAYSVITHETIQKNDYYIFNAGISFAVFSDSKTSLNADVIMQSNGSEYTDSVFWNPNNLSTYGVAVSKNVASAHNLHIGDKLYSKHNVNGEIYDYTIEQIIPDLLHPRMTEKISYSNGIIVMGYDQRYVDNITHVWIAFIDADKKVEELSEAKDLMPEKIVYRDDEIVLILIKIIPYVVVLLILSIASVVAFTAYVSKSISYNFHRLIMLGFSNKQLNIGYNKNVVRGGIIMILIEAALSGTAMYLMGICSIGAALICLILFAESIALLIASLVCKSQLWRN